MSRDEPGICTSPDEMLPLAGAIPVPSSSRASSSSSLRFIGIANGSSDRLAEAPPPLTSSSQSSLPRSASDVMPQTEGSANGSGTSTPEIDVQILEALKSKDRLFVLKIGEQMEALIREKNSRSRITLSPENQYQRLLVHRCAAYYKLTLENEPALRDKSGTRDMTVLIMIESRIPSRRISELVPVEQAQHPTFKIMRRTDLDRRRQKSSISRPGSTADEDGELSDPGPSESGSMGSRSTTSKKRMTIAEREAAYAQARSRIFMDFEEKEKAKERDSASSSTLSLVSASGSGSHSGGAGGSSVSDIDDNASTAPTESEWSVSGTDRRRGGDSGISSADSTRSFPSYTVQSSGNDRASGTASPAFTYPSLYDPSAQAQVYEHGGYMPHPGGYMAPYPMYAYPHPPPNAGPIPPGGQSYMAPYQYFPQYPYTNPSHQPSHSSSDPASPVTGPAETYPHHAVPVPFMSPNGYGWMPPTAQQHNPSSETHSSPNSGANHAQTPPAQSVQHMAYPYPPHYMGPHGAVPYAGYPPYFQPPPQTHHSLIHPHSQPRYPIELPPTNGNASDRGTSSGLSSGNGSPSPTLSRHTNSSGSSNGNHNPMGNNGGSKRGAPATRGAWSYGPGIGMNGNVINSGVQNGPVGETVGPRLSSAMRRTSGTSSNSGGYRTPGDETASVASSSTSSSSSRRTYMSTPSMHPLPARPDWAAGLKAQPTLHPPVRHRNDSNGSRTMSPARPPGQALHSHQHQQPVAQQRPPIVLQPTDFPPLSSLSSPSDKRPPAGSVWANRNTAARAIVAASPGQANHSQGNALFNHSNGNRLEDDERGFERPPPKVSAELFNPKGGAKRVAQADARQNVPDGAGSKIEKERTRGEIIASAILVDKMEALKIQAQPDEIEFENTPKADSLLSGLPYVPKLVGINTGEGSIGSVADGGASST